MWAADRDNKQWSDVWCNDDDSEASIQILFCELMYDSTTACLMHNFEIKIFLLKLNITFLQKIQFANVNSFTEEKIHVS